MGGAGHLYIVAKHVPDWNPIDYRLAHCSSLKYSPASRRREGHGRKEPVACGRRPRQLETRGFDLEGQLNRRGILRTAFAASAAALGFGRYAKPVLAQTKHIRLYVEMDVAPAREREMLDTITTQKTYPVVLYDEV